MHNKIEKSKASEIQENKKKKTRKILFDFLPENLSGNEMVEGNNVMVDANTNVQEWTKLPMYNNNNAHDELLEKEKMSKTPLNTDNPLFEMNTCIVQKQEDNQLISKQKDNLFLNKPQEYETKDILKQIEDLKELVTRNEKTKEDFHNDPENYIIKLKMENDDLTRQVTELIVQNNQLKIQTDNLQKVYTSNYGIFDSILKFTEIQMAAIDHMGKFAQSILEIQNQIKIQNRLEIQKNTSMSSQSIQEDI